MPCGCKKGSGVSFRGGGMTIRGGGIRKRKRRRRKKKGSGLIGADPRTWAPSSTNRYAGLGGRSSGFRSAFVGGKRGSGMGFSGAGMAFHGAGLRSGRLFLRRGTGRRMI